MTGFPLMSTIEYEIPFKDPSASVAEAVMPTVAPVVPHSFIVFSFESVSVMADTSNSFWSLTLIAKF